MKFNWKFLLFSLFGAAIRLIPLAVQEDLNPQPSVSSQVQDTSISPLLALKSELIKN